MEAANKVAFNTAILYTKTLITAGIGFYSTRLILNALGVTDYGIYNLVAGVIAMLSFLNAAMSTSTQRYLSYHQGKNNISIQKQIFTNSLLLHIVLGIIIAVALEIVGLYLFSGFLNIPPERISVAKFIYHFMAITILFSIISVPFTASLNAHENMLWISIVNIVETVLKLLIALSLFIIEFDRLIYFAFLTTGISAISLIMYVIYCLRKYPECSLDMSLNFKPKLMKELTSFAGWNLFGALCGLGRTQGLAIILNLFLGTVVNAAYGIANQITGQLNFFSASMLRTLNPQIMKSEGANNRKRMLRLSMMASKFGFFLLAFIAIPCIFEMPAILKFWLKNVPDYTIMLCSLLLAGVMINQLTVGLQSAVQATGKIKFYQAIVGSLLLLNLPAAYILLKKGFSIQSVMISYIIIEIVACAARLFFLRKIAGLSISEYFQKVFFKEIIPVASSLIVCYATTTYWHIEYRFILTIILSSIVFMAGIYLAGLCKDEKDILNAILVKLKRKKENETSIYKYNSRTILPSRPNH